MAFTRQYSSSIDPSILAYFDQQAPQGTGADNAWTGNQFGTRPEFYANPGSNLQDPNTLWYIPAYTQTNGGQGSDGPAPEYTLSGYSVGNYNQGKGGYFGNYDANGKFLGTENYWQPDKEAWMDDAAMAAMGMFMGGFGAMAGGAGGAGAELSGMDLAADGFGTGNALPGFELPSGMDLAADGAGISGSGAGASGGSAGNGLVSGSEVFTNKMNLPPEQTLMQTGGGSAVKNALANALGISPQTLGLGASLLGGALSAGQKNPSADRSIPEWLKGYATPALDAGKGLLQQQMSWVPQQAQQIANSGMGLLSQPIAGNGFAQFQQRPALFRSFGG